MPEPVELGMYGLDFVGWICGEPDALAAGVYSKCPLSRMPSRDLKNNPLHFLDADRTGFGCKPLEYFQQVKYGTAPLPV